MNEMNISILTSQQVYAPYSILTLHERLVAHDLAGDGTLLFVAAALPREDPSIRVFHQDSKKELGRFPAPARGFLIPFKFRLRSYKSLGKDGSKGILYALDSGLPRTAGFHDALLLKYEYEYNSKQGLRSRLLKEYSIASNKIPWEQVQKGSLPDGAIYVTSFDVIDDKYIALADCIAGIIWLSDMETEVKSIAFTSPDFLVKPWPDDLKITLSDGRIVNGFTGWTHKNREELVPYLHKLPLTPNIPQFVPGLHGLTLYENGPKKKVVFVSPAHAGIYAIDVGELMRTDIPAHQKRYETVVPQIRGLTSWVAEVQADTFNLSSPWVFFQRMMSRPNEPAKLGFETWRDKHNPLYRVNMETGQVEFVAEDWKLWDYNSNLNVIPFKAGFTRLSCTPVQQHRVPEANDLINDSDDYSRLPNDFVFPVIDVKN
jgi:hypothetical protein